MPAPCHGVIVDRKGGELKVHLSNGAKIHVAEQKGLRLGDECYIIYDYTRLAVAEIWTLSEYNDSGSAPAEEPFEEELDGEDADTLALASLGLCFS